jgi:hypothetical protein
MAAANRDVFINCPFDSDYQRFFYAIVYAVLRSGFSPRCALETDDASENRFEKICAIVGQCRFGIHDISRTELDRQTGLPRFNMPLELGVFLGAKRFGGTAQKSKRCLVLDRDRHRFRSFMSDISGQDIHSHGNDSAVLLREVSSWLRDQSRDQKVPGGRKMVAEFAAFEIALPAICARRQLDVDELTFGDLTELISEYTAATA